MACFSFPRAGPRVPGFPLSHCHQAPPCASPASTLHGRAALPPPAPAMPRSYAGWAPTAPPPHPAVAPGPLTPFLLYSSKPILPPPLFVSPSIFFHAGNRRRKPPLLQSVGQRHVELPLAASRSAILYKKPRSCRPLFTIRPPRPLLVARPLRSASSLPTPPQAPPVCRTPRWLLKLFPPPLLRLATTSSLPPTRATACNQAWWASFSFLPWDGFTPWRSCCSTGPRPSPHHCPSAPATTATPTLCTVIAAHVRGTPRHGPAEPHGSWARPIGWGRHGLPVWQAPHTAQSGGLDLYSELDQIHMCALLHCIKFLEVKSLSN
jgi:hypothetical protein